MDIPEQTKKVVTDYIMQNEFNDELVENVAKMLDAIANEMDVAANIILDTAEKAESFRDELKDMSDAYLDESNDTSEEMQEDMIKAMDELGSEEAPASPVMDAPIVDAPVTDNNMGTPVGDISQTMETPVVPVSPVVQVAETSSQVIPENPVIEEVALPPVPMSSDPNSSPLQEVPMTPVNEMPQQMMDAPVMTPPTPMVETPVMETTQTDSAPVMPWQQNPTGNPVPQQ